MHHAECMNVSLSDQTHHRDVIIAMNVYRCIQAQQVFLSHQRQASHCVYLSVCLSNCYIKKTFQL